MLTRLLKSRTDFVLLYVDKHYIFDSEADNVAGDILKDFREGIIFIGRILLVSTFIEDAIRMWHQWQDHKDYIGNAWSFTDEIATFIVIVNLIGQCTGK